jgi:hypothetical protein
MNFCAEPDFSFCISCITQIRSIVQYYWLFTNDYTGGQTWTGSGVSLGDHLVSHAATALACLGWHMFGINLLNRIIFWNWPALQSRDKVTWGSRECTSKRLLRNMHTRHQIIANCGWWSELWWKKVKWLLSKSSSNLFIYLLWSRQSTTVFRVTMDENQWTDILEEAHLLNGTTTPKWPTCN